MIVRGGTVVTARGVERADVVVNHGRIAEVGPHLEGYGQVIDGSGLHVFPGGIDSHVHFNEPGRTDWETIASGSAALAAGGYTSFIDMPLNNLPVTTTVEAFDMKVEAMRRSAGVDYGLWAGLIPGNLDQLEPLVVRGAMGFKAFMCPSGIDEFPPCDVQTLRDGMAKIAELGSVLLVHAESPAKLKAPAGPTAREFLDSRPPDAEIEAIRDLAGLARDTGCRTHVVHVSTVQGMTMIAEAQLHGVEISGETCTHYLLYCDADLERLGGAGKCAPPFRSAGNRDDMLAILAAGEIEMVVSDHSPSTLALKEGADFRKIWGGISGCQSTRQLLLAQDRLDLPTVAALTATNVARRFHLPDKGDIAPGFDADLWLVDLDHEDVVRREDLLYRNPPSAHEGQRIRGRTVKTLVRGLEAGPAELIRPGERL
jgi:allantoinase